MSKELVEYFRNELMQEVQNALLFQRTEPTDLPEFKRPEEPVLSTVAPAQEPFGMAKLMNVAPFPDDGALDGGLPQSRDPRVMYKVQLAGGQEKYAAQLAKASEPEEEYDQWTGVTRKTFKDPSGNIVSVQNWRNGKLEDVLDGGGNLLKATDRLAKHASRPHVGALAKVFDTGIDDVIGYKDIQHYVPR